MKIQLLSLLFVSPIIAFSIHLLIIESRDSLSGFHEEFARATFNSRGAEARRNSLESKKYTTFFKVIISRKIQFSSLLIFFLISAALGAGMKILIILASIACAYLFWETDRLSRIEAKKEALIELELPSIVELFSILVSSGASPAVALLEISNIAHGEFPTLLVGIREKLKNGGNLREALEVLSRNNRSISVRRFCDSLIIAIERGTSLSDVLSRQVEELRSSHKAALIRQASRVEIQLMIPVVFLILPISILFALWPSYVALGTSIG